ncbi:hypothetical protein AMK59_2355 [Oryctes borbonicus]|uniref:FIP-RBD domain-containing protein n=1 Tax=Oryctes borbonicus TaxID=1629725 RepID=A0A0T6BGD6_9SCAR|nr:hypothetical protein AMK59_2355 [Oryctes borbonicus]
MHLKSKKKDDDDSSSVGSVGSLKHRSTISEPKSKQTIEDADPGVVSEDDEFTFDDLSHKSSGSSLNQVQAPANNNITTNNIPKIKSESFENINNTEPVRRHTVANIPAKPPRSDFKPPDEWDLKLYGNKSKNLLKPPTNDTLNRRSWESPTLSSRIEEEEDTEPSQTEKGDTTTTNKASDTPKVENKERESRFSLLKPFRKEKSDTDLKSDKNTNERIIIGGENDNSTQNFAPTTNNRVSNEILQKFEGKSREDIILLTCELQSELDHNKKKLKDLEDYLDELLLRVMETTPRILQNPYINCKLTHQKLADLMK